MDAGGAAPIWDVSTNVYRDTVDFGEFDIGATEVPGVQPMSPEATRLARRLRHLRVQQWPDARLTQAKLAKALGAEDPLQAATVSSWESNTAPKLPPRHRLQAYARFFATERSLSPSPRLLPLDALTPDETVVYKRLETELLGLRNSLAEDNSENEDIPARRSWKFTDEGPVTLVCAQLPADQTGPLAEPTNRNHTELHQYADTDALIELHGHIRAENPRMQVYFRIPDEVGHDDLTGHLILIGGVVWNEISDRLAELANLPVDQVERPGLDSGEIFVVKDGPEGEDGPEREFWPRLNTETDHLAQDVGLLARVPNPLNSSRTLTICNGIHSRGVYGAVRTLTDTHLRDANERWIVENFGDAASFAILMSVQVIKNKAITPDFSSNGVVLYKWSQDTVTTDTASR